mgnify:CR=1 FL=1
MVTAFLKWLQSKQKNMDEHTILVHKLLYPTDYSYRGPWPFSSSKKKSKLREEQGSDLTKEKKAELEKLFNALLKQGTDAKKNVYSKSYKSKEAAFNTWVDVNCKLKCTIKTVYKILIRILLKQKRKRMDHISFKKEVEVLNDNMYVNQHFTKQNLKDMFGAFRYRDSKDLNNSSSVNKVGVKQTLENTLAEVQKRYCDPAASAD